MSPNKFDGIDERITRLNFYFLHKKPQYKAAVFLNLVLSVGDDHAEFWCLGVLYHWSYDVAYPHHPFAKYAVCRHRADV